MNRDRDRDYVPVSHLSAAGPRRLSADRGGGDRAATWRGSASAPATRSPYFTAAPGQHARLRRLQPQRDQPRARRRRRRTARSSRRLSAHGLGHIVDFVPNHMGIGTGGNAWWKRRARERPELAGGAVLRHRLGAGEGGAARQAAAADPRRSVRPRARARRAAARRSATARWCCTTSSTSCRSTRGRRRASSAWPSSR